MHVHRGNTQTGLTTELPFSSEVSVYCLDFRALHSGNRYVGLCTVCTVQDKQYAADIETYETYSLTCISYLPILKFLPLRHVSSSILWIWDSLINSDKLFKIKNNNTHIVNGILVCTTVMDSRWWDLVSAGSLTLVASAGRRWRAVLYHTSLPGGPISQSTWPNFRVQSSLSILSCLCHN